ncbi:MAG TPA: hypothetical protein VMW10_01040 [Alphaproteobacteria bacterium]|nr:hypothetical protein [Alphaproteobacteria bacterium]
MNKYFLLLTTSFLAFEACFIACPSASYAMEEQKLSKNASRKKKRAEAKENPTSVAGSKNQVNSEAEETVDGTAKTEPKEDALVEEKGVAAAAQRLVEEKEAEEEKVRLAKEKEAEEARLKLEEEKQAKAAQEEKERKEKEAAAQRLAEENEKKAKEAAAAQREAKKLEKARKEKQLAEEIKKLEIRQKERRAAERRKEETARKLVEDIRLETERFSRSAERQGSEKQVRREKDPKKLPSFEGRREKEKEREKEKRAVVSDEEVARDLQRQFERGAKKEAASSQEKRMYALPPLPVRSNSSGQVQRRVPAPALTPAPAPATATQPLVAPKVAVPIVKLAPVAAKPAPKVQHTYKKGFNRTTKQLENK